MIVPIKRVLSMSKGGGDQNDEKPDDVGYQKPPKQTRFKRGMSGNTKGRPKNSKNFATVLRAELNSFVVATEGGKRRKIRKIEAMIKNLVNKAASGDAKAMAMLFQEQRTHQGKAKTEVEPDALQRPEDQLVIASIVRRIRQMDEPISETADRDSFLKPKDGEAEPTTTEPPTDESKP